MDNLTKKGSVVMFIKILMKDLKRNKTMNVILFLFVIIASIFFASGIYNLLAVINGTDYQFSKAGIEDCQIVTTGEDVIGTLDEKLDAMPEVKAYKKDTCIFVSKGDLMSASGEKYDVINVGMLHSVDRLGIILFDKDDEAIREVPMGKVYTSGKFLRANDLKEGDTIFIEKGDVKRSFTIAGSLKDAFLGSEFMGNPRFLMNERDFSEYFEDAYANRYFGGEVIYVTTDEASKVVSEISEMENITYLNPTSMLKLAYIMNLILAFVVVILSCCLMIVSFLVLRFSIHFSIDEDFREIGVMKAIGIGNTRIRGLYLIKYSVIAVVGSLIGLLISIPFAKLLLKQTTQDMILGTEYGFACNILGAVLVAVLVILSAFLSTRKVKKLTPVDAVRSGQIGERFKKKGGIRLSGSRLKTTGFLAINDALSKPKRFVAIIITFSLCTLFVLILVNTKNTMNSDKLIDLFGPRSDVYITDTNQAMKYAHADEEALKKHLDELAEKYTKAGMPCKVSMGLLYSYPVEVNGMSYSLSAEQGVNMKSGDYKLSKGSSPRNKGEVVVSSQVESLTGATIGDSIRIDFGNGPEELLVTGIYQSMNQLGKTILLHEDAETDFSHMASFLQYRLDFLDSPDQKTVDERIAKIKEMTGNNEVYNAVEYCRDCVRVYDIMDVVSKLLLLIVLVVVLLVTVLMERSFIADEKNEIAMAKAIGFRDSGIITWHVKRFLFVAFLAMLIAVGLSIPVTQLTISPIFGMMGASKIEFNYDIRYFVAYPVIILGVTILTAYLTALSTKKIVSRDTASIE